LGPTFTAVDTEKVAESVGVEDAVQTMAGRIKNCGRGVVWGGVAVCSDYCAAREGNCTGNVFFAAETCFCCGGERCWVLKRVWTDLLKLIKRLAGKKR
jgi:hypothetical protein